MVGLPERPLAVHTERESLRALLLSLGTRRLAQTDMSGAGVPLFFLAFMLDISGGLA